jgi:hypothetical protein
MAAMSPAFRHILARRLRQSERVNPEDAIRAEIIL